MPKFANKQRVLDIRQKDPLRKAIEIAWEIGISALGFLDW